MIYSNPEFIVFFGAVLGGYVLLGSFRGRYVLLAGASLLFYLWSGVHDTLVFASVVVASWLAAWAGNRWPVRRRLFISLGILVMALHLFFWKYAPWLCGQVQAMFPGFLGGRTLVLTLPVGISFFTLQGIAYLVDFARGEVPFIRFRDYALFKSFFPQLVAGPIVRVPQLLPQLGALRTPRSEDLAIGLSLFLMGFLKKLLVADRCAPFVDAVFRNPGAYDRLTLLIAAVGYGVQLWADFSGYTDMGRGAARMLGIRLPENFLSPYLARSPSEFWRRWHVTLSEWIRDYVYIPLGGGRGSAGRVALVGLATMAISGLWHGANWTFLLWGLYHGALLTGERALRRRGVLFGTPARAAWAARTWLPWGLTQTAVFGGWVLFRAPTFDMFGGFASGIVHGGAGELPGGSGSIVAGTVLCALAHVIFYRDLESGRLVVRERLAQWGRSGVGGLAGHRDFPVLLGVVCGALLVLVVLSSLALRLPNTAPAFIYFQF